MTTMADEHRLREIRERADADGLWLLARYDELVHEAELAEVSREMAEQEAYGNGYEAAVLSGEVETEFERKVIERVAEAVLALRPPPA